MPCELPTLVLLALRATELAPDIDAVSERRCGLEQITAKPEQSTNARRQFSLRKS